MLRSRLASLLLILASPALGGIALPLAHPCPVDAPWLAQGSGAADEHAGHHGESQAPTDQTHLCICPSACTAALGLSAPAASGVLAIPSTPVRVFPQVPEASAPWAHASLDLLPPSTAPPIA